MLLVGLGKAADFGPKEYREAVRAAVRALGESGASEALLYLAELPVQGSRRGVERDARARRWRATPATASIS